MTAQLKTFAKGIDLTTIKTYLFGPNEVKSRYNQ